MNGVLPLGLERGMWALRPDAPYRAAVLKPSGERGRCRLSVRRYEQTNADAPRRTDLERSARCRWNRSKQTYAGAPHGTINSVNQLRNA